jgi:integrase
MTNPSKKYKTRGPLTNEEIQGMLDRASRLQNEYFRLRVRALIAILKKFGKRRLEISTLKLTDLKVENDFLFITFTLRKKHKFGLFQYLKVLKKTNPDGLNKSYPILVSEWQTWRLTEQGQHVKEERRTKKVSLSDRYARLILEYVTYLNEKYPKAEYVFPSGRTVFGQSYLVVGDRSLSGRQLLNLIKPLNPRAWLHLFRELVGKEIAEEDNTIAGVYKVKESLDLENEETAWRYIRRFGIQEVKVET